MTEENISFCVLCDAMKEVRYAADALAIITSAYDTGEEDAATISNALKGIYKLLDYAYIGCESVIEETGVQQK